MPTGDMDYISTKEYAMSHGVAERTVRNYCLQGKIAGAQLIGKTWNVPADAPPLSGQMQKSEYRPC